MAGCGNGGRFYDNPVLIYIDPIYPNPITMLLSTTAFHCALLIILCSFLGCTIGLLGAVVIRNSGDTWPCELL